MTKQLPAEYTLARVRKLKRGQGLLGPEFYGCCNTGSRPLIFRAWKGNAWQWIVCREIDIDEARRNNFTFKLNGKRVLGKGKQRMYYIRTSASAFKKWMELVEERKAENAECAAQAAAARERLKNNPTDVGAALELGDLGVL